MSVWVGVAMLVWLATVEYRLYLARRCVEDLLKLISLTRKP